MVAAFFSAANPASSAEKPESGAVQRMPTVTALDSSILTEEVPVGPTARPEWTSARRFPGTRVYIQQNPWEFGIESWWRLKHKRDGTLRHRLLEEVEIGLPGRMQLDLYNDIEGDDTGAFHYQSFNVELRWALADWGAIWGNPTLYGEYKFADRHWGPDVYEFKLLLGDQLAPRWHWGVNFVWEAETGGEREQEFQITGGLSYTVLDGKLGAGIEAFFDRDSVKGARGNADDLFAVGPSVQWRVTKNLHIDLSCLFGTNNATERQIGFLVIGYDFGGSDDRSRHDSKNGFTPQESKPRRYAPISGQRN